MRSNKKPLAIRARAIAQVTLAAAIASGVAVSPVPACSAELNWPDVESRIQYGYYTEDPRSLGSVMELLSPADSGDALKSYYAGLGNYRLALLSAPTNKGRAKETARHCVSSLDHALQDRKDFAEAMALQSACLEVLANLEPWRAPFTASRSGAQIEQARHLAPANPRVLLMDAVGNFERPKATGADRQRAAGEFRKATAAFEAERTQVDPVPGWGAAEAYVYLARCYLETGDTLQARDALERALLLAPGFVQAKRLMAKITTG